MGRIWTPDRHMRVTRRIYQDGNLMALYMLLNKSAGVVCTAGTSTIPNLTSFETATDNAAAGAKWDTDGGVYYYDNSMTRNFPGARNGGTWIGDCANTEYDGRWSVQSPGDAPTFSNTADGVWRQMSIGDISVEYEETNNNGGTLIGNFTFELRRRSDQVIILTDAFTMDVEVDAGK